MAQPSEALSGIAHFAEDEPLPLDSGGALTPFSIAFQTYGSLNAAKSNAVMVCHALTGDQHVVGTHPVTGKAGWWETLVGPGKPIDTDRYFVICSEYHRRMHGHRLVRPRSIRRPGVPTASNFRSSPSAIWCGPRRC